MKTVNHHIPLIAGLGSSICPRRYSAWARDLKKRLLREVHPAIGIMVINIASSDGNGEDRAILPILNDHRRGTLGKVMPVGHSNGAAEVCVLSSMCYEMGIDIPVMSIIDMTLGEELWDAEVYGSVECLLEFWAGLEKADLHESFEGTHRFYDLDEMAGRNVGHVEAASHRITQDRIVAAIKAELE